MKSTEPDAFAMKTCSSRSIQTRELCLFIAKESFEYWQAVNRYPASSKIIFENILLFVTLGCPGVIAAFHCLNWHLLEDL